MVQATGGSLGGPAEPDPRVDTRAAALAAVRHPANAAPIAAFSDLVAAVQRSKALRQQGAPARSLLLHLARDGAMRASDLAASVGLDQSTVSRHLAQLEGSGLVVRTPEPADRRAHLIAVTEQGVAEVQEVIASRVHDLEQVFDGWTNADRAQLARLLTRFTDAYVASFGDRADDPR